MGNSTSARFLTTVGGALLLALGGPGFASASTVGGAASSFDYWGDSGGVFHTVALSKISYSAGLGSASNDVTYGPATAVVGGCGPTIGPGSCTNLLEANLNMIADASGTLTAATGWCKLAGPALATCRAPVVNRFYSVTSGVQPLVVQAALGGGADRFRTVIDPATQGADLRDTPYRITVNAGAGNDHVELIDRTADETDGRGVDQVDCGAGNDSVVVGSSTVVADDCETVQRIG
jgi:hypothetical protein